jgi:hypothetical protein
MTIQEAQEWVKAQEWVYAKSYSETYPHFYTKRALCDEMEFEDFLKCIREHGTLKAFHSKQYIYLELDGFEYWEMGRPIPCVQVLNKAAINESAGYRKKKPTQEEDAEIKSKFLQREVYLQQLVAEPNPSEQQKAQIAFLMDTQRRIHGGGKNIIDHSNLPVRYE